MLWRLYYEDGSTFSDRDGEPWKSPLLPVLCIQPWRIGNEQLMCAGDWYMWRTDLRQWTQCGASGMEDHAQLYGHLIRAWRKTLWVQGTVRDGVYGEILARARADLKAING